MCLSTGYLSGCHSFHHPEYFALICSRENSSPPTIPWFVFLNSIVFPYLILIYAFVWFTVWPYFVTPFFSFHFRHSVMSQMVVTETTPPYLIFVSLCLQILSTGWWYFGQSADSGQCDTKRWCWVVYFRLQSRTGHRRVSTVAVVWAIRSCSKCKGDSWLTIEQMQRLWLCHDDQLWWSTGRYTESEWIHTW